VFIFTHKFVLLSAETDNTSPENVFI